MPHVSEDRVLETTTTTGTGALTLAGALTGFRTFASVCTVNDTLWYYAEEVDGNGNPTGAWEEGLGTYSAVNTLTRTTVFRSTNGNAAVNFAAGTKRVALTLIGRRTVQLDNALAAFLPAAPAEPGTPSGGVVLYARELAPGHTALKIKRPSGVDSPIQDALAFNRLQRFGGPGAALALVGITAAVTTGSTFSAVTPASGAAKTATPRTQLASGATAGNVAPIAFAAGICPMMRGNVAGEGGFRFVTRFALQQQQAANRGFWGIADSNAVATNVDPTTVTTPGKVGLAINSNTGNWNLVHNVSGTAPTVIALGANFPVDTTSLMELLLFCRPHNGTAAGDIGYRVRRYTTSSADAAFEATGTLTTNIPAATTLLQPWMFMTNNATAAAVQWHLAPSTVEADW